MIGMVKRRAFIYSVGTRKSVELIRTKKAAHLPSDSDHQVA
jgi:hypothetical protein